MSGVQVKLEEGNQDDREENHPIRARELPEAEEAEEFGERLPSKKLKQEQRVQIRQLFPKIEQTVVPEVVQPNQEIPPPPAWIYWTWSSEFTKEEDIFTKLNSDSLRKVHALEPLPAQGRFRFRVRAISNCTFSFGIMTEDRIAQDHVYFKDQQAIFLTSFQNGSAVMNISGEDTQFKRYGRQLNLEPGKSMDVRIDMDKRILIICKVEKTLTIPFTSHFANKSVYPFFQVKNAHASICIQRMQ